MSDFFIHCFVFPASLTINSIVPFFSVLLGSRDSLVKSCQGTVRVIWWQSSPNKGSPASVSCPSAQHPPPPLLGWKTLYLHGTCGQVFLECNKEAGVLREMENYLILRSALLQQGPSYHEFITAIQHQLLGDIWRVPSVTIAVSGVPQGCILAPFKFLFALLGIKGASACKHGLFLQPAFPISRRAALQAVKLGRGHRLRYTRACWGRSGIEVKAPGCGRGRRG